jgi:ketosteroid isomerase-like protein
MVAAMLTLVRIISRGEQRMVAIKDLDRFFEHGWNAQDLDVLMSLMADDCIFETAGGPEAFGTRYRGREHVREGFRNVFARFPNARFDDTRHFIAGDRGVSEWTFTGTTTDGRKIEVNGCDLFTFRDNKIALKSSYFKNRTV